MEDLRVLDVHSDSGFKREEDSAYAIRGANFLRLGRSRKSGRIVAHLLDSVCRSHKLVARNTYSAEVIAATAAADEAFLILITLEEFINGPMGAR